MILVTPVSSLPTMSFSRPLLKQDIWSRSRDINEAVSPNYTALHYQRAQSICRQSGGFPASRSGPKRLMIAETRQGLGLDDIRYLTEKFWDFHFDCKCRHVI